MKNILPLIAIVGLCPMLAFGQLSTTDNASVKVAAGETLSVIANSRYGSRAYAGFLAAYNQVNPERLQIGMSIETSDLLDALRKSGAHAQVPAESEATAALIAEFRLIEIDILQNRFSNQGKEVYEPLSEDLLKRISGLSSKILELRKLTDESTKFTDDRRKLLVAVLTEATESARTIHAISSDSYAQDVEQLHRRFDTVLTILVASARQHSQVGIKD